MVDLELLPENLRKYYPKFIEFISIESDGTSYWKFCGDYYFKLQHKDQKEIYCTLESDSFDCKISINVLWLIMYSYSKKEITDVSQYWFNVWKPNLDLLPDVLRPFIPDFIKWSNKEEGNTGVWKFCNDYYFKTQNKDQTEFPWTLGPNYFKYGYKKSLNEILTIIQEIKDSNPVLSEYGQYVADHKIVYKERNKG